jgi:hypothetical protein
MLRNIIVQPHKLKPNKKWFNLSIKDKPLKPSTPKTQKVFHPKTVFDELGIVVKITTRSKNSHREKPNKNQERWCQVYKSLSSLRSIRLSYSLESPS